MFAKVLSAATVGVEAEVVEVEVDVQRAQFPSFALVGLADTAIKESRERIRAAFHNVGYDFSWSSKVTINLAPADVPKEGSMYDLPMAIGLLAATGQIEPDVLKNYVLIGELALEGRVRPIKGALPIALLTRREHIQGLIVPSENAPEAAMVKDLPVFPVSQLSEAVGFLNGLVTLQPLSVPPLEDFFKTSPQSLDVDFSEVKGNEHVKRALAIAAAGQHNLLMMGPPGVGKTMLAKRLMTILPPFSLEEAIETTKIYSVAGYLDKGQSLVQHRPFRSPHHTISEAGLVGGGTYPRPGEISLAHNGVLFLDELPEFSRHVLETLRQPLEDGKITVGRAQASITYPARFMLIATMNPCPCGYFGDPHHPCKCTPREIMRYRARISGPLLDRIDLHIEVSSLPPKELSTYQEGTDSKALAESVQVAREKQRERFQKDKIQFNAQMSARGIKKVCRLDKETEDFLYQAMENLALSARAHSRILKMSRTIADMEGSDPIRHYHISEAIQYRSLDRDFLSL